MQQQQLDFGATFSRVFELYSKHFVSLVTYSAIFYGVVAVLWALATGVGELSDDSGGAIALLAIAGFIAAVFTTGAYIIGLNDAERTGEFPGFGEVWPRVTPFVVPMLVAGLLAGLGVAVGIVLLIIPGLILLTWWAVISPVVVLEDKRGVDALKRSRELVRGNGWTVFGLIIVTSLIAGIAGAILGAIAGSLLGFDETVSAFATEFVSGTISGPVTALLAVVLYQELSKQPQPPQYAQYAHGVAHPMDPAAASAHGLPDQGYAPPAHTPVAPPPMAPPVAAPPAAPPMTPPPPATAPGHDHGQGQDQGQGPHQV